MIANWHLFVEILGTKLKIFFTCHGHQNGCNLECWMYEYCGEKLLVNLIWKLKGKILLSFLTRPLSGKEFYWVQPNWWKNLSKTLSISSIFSLSWPKKLTVFSFLRWKMHSGTRKSKVIKWHESNISRQFLLPNISLLYFDEFFILFLLLTYGADSVWITRRTVGFG